MSYQIIECSPRARAKIAANAVDQVGLTPSERSVKYPFGDLLIGQCFTLPAGSVVETSLRVMACRYATQHKKRFAVLKHPEFNCVEVARIA